MKCDLILTDARQLQKGCAFAIFKAPQKMKRSAIAKVYFTKNEGAPQKIKHIKYLGGIKPQPAKMPTFVGNERLLCLRIVGEGRHFRWLRLYAA